MRGPARVVLPPGMADRVGKWPRLPDYRAQRAVIDIPPDPGELVSLGCGRAILFAIGAWTGIDVSRRVTAASDFFPLLPGIPLPGEFRWRQAASGANGTVTIIGWELTEDESRDAALSGALSSIAASLVTLSQFPDSSALGDADPNPTTTRVGANALIWNSVNTQWNRLRSIPSAVVTGRMKSQDTWKSVDSLTALSTLLPGPTLMYTCPAGKVARIFLHIFCSAFTVTSTCRLDRSGGVFFQFSTVAVGNIASNLGPIVLSAGATLNVNVTVGGTGTVLLTQCIEERYAE